MRPITTPTSTMPRTRTPQARDKFEQLIQQHDREGEHEDHLPLLPRQRIDCEYILRIPRERRVRSQR